MLIAARSSQDFACWARATASARSKYASAFAASGSGDIERDFTRHAKDIGLDTTFPWLLSTTVIASPMQRQASSNCPSCA